MKRQPITQDQINGCVEIISGIPKSTSGFRCWKMEPRMTAVVVAVAIRSDSPRKSAEMIAKAAGHSPTALYNFLNGKDTGAQKWQELRNELAKLGVSHLVRGKYAEETTAVDVASEIEYIDALDKAATARRQSDKVPAAGFTITHLGGEVVPVTVKPATLATTNKGEVVATTPPKIDTSPMVAAPGQFATKTNGIAAVAPTPLPVKVCRKYDPTSGDIIVTRTTTQVLKYGTPEHQAAHVVLVSQALKIITA